MCTARQRKLENIKHGLFITSYFNMFFRKEPNVCKAKAQEILKANCVVLNSSKKPKKKFAWFPPKMVKKHIYNNTYVSQLSATMMSWVGLWGDLVVCNKIFILFSENSQILFKISVISIPLSLMYLVALSLLVNYQLNSWSNSIHHCGR